MGGALGVNVATSAQIEKTVPTPTVSIAARLDQMEAAIGEAHALVDGIAGLAVSDAMEKQPNPVGAEACLDRCQAHMQQLISRLASIRDRVGQL